MGTLCKLGVEKGLALVLCLNNTCKREILKYHVRIEKGVYKMNLENTRRELQA